MSVLRDHPYETGNFLVEIAGLNLSGAQAISQVELPEAIIDEVSHREGGGGDARKQPGGHRYGHLVIKRGLTGSIDFWQWFSQVRNGESVDRAVAVILLDESQNEIWRWAFTNAFPVAYRVNALDSAESEVAIEELTLTFDRMDIE